MIRRPWQWFLWEVKLRPGSDASGYPMTRNVFVSKRAALKAIRKSTVLGRTYEIRRIRRQSPHQWFKRLSGRRLK